MPEPLINAGYSDPLKTEKVNGVIYNMAAGTAEHAEAVSNIIAILNAFFAGKHCKPFTSKFEIHLDDDNTYRPDVSVICDFSKRQRDGYHGSPALIIEVLSKSTAYRDRGDKFFNYEKYGVQEYLIVSPEYETVDQYALIDGAFKLLAIHFKRGTVFDSYIFDGLKFELDIIFEYREE